MNWNLTPLEQDIFKEIANIGLSKAADALAILSKERVLLHVPEIKLVTPQQLIKAVLPDNQNSKDAIVIKSDIVGELAGNTVLIFSEKDTSVFIRESLAHMKEYDTRFEALRNSFLLEISNIVTGSVLTQISNIFGMKVHGSVPVGPETDPVRSLQDILRDFPAFQPIIFTVKTNFMNTGRNLQLPLVIILDTDTMLKLLMIIRSKNVFAKNILAS
jgi:chemotaxis protein CheC